MRLSLKRKLLLSYQETLLSLNLMLLYSSDHDTQGSIHWLCLCVDSDHNVRSMLQQCFFFPKDALKQSIFN